MHVGELLPLGWRHDREAVAAVLHPTCEVCDALRGELEAVRARISRAGGELRSHATAGDACILIADRWGKIHARLEAHSASPRALAVDAADWLEFIQMECPECGVPEW
jgi:hypothetical protein